MTGKKLLLNALHYKPVPRVPWVPFAGVHAGKLVGYTATEILQDAKKLFKALCAVNDQYQPDGQPVVFDLQIEAEILGCDLVWPDKGPPVVVSHPFAPEKNTITHFPTPTDGRLPIILESMRHMQQEIGSHTALFGLICGPLTLASHLRGTDIFMDMFDDPPYVNSLMESCTQAAKCIADFYIKAGMDVIALVDPIVSQISPEHFQQFLSKVYTDLFATLRDQNVASSFFVCGDATRNIEGMCQTHPDSIFVDENIDMVSAQKITDQYEIALGGNIPLSSAMLLGTQQDNMQCVLNQLDTLNHQGLVIAPGCDMPYDIPPENVIGVLQALHEPQRVRALLESYEKEEQNLDVQLPDYTSLERPLIEVITLDSATCPACTYMMNAVNVAKNHFGDRVDVAEYKIVHAENIPRVQKMGIKNLPAVVINGELAFSSIIPSKRDLFARIDQHLHA